MYGYRGLTKKDSFLHLADPIDSTFGRALGNIIINRNQIIWRIRVILKLRPSYYKWVMNESHTESWGIPRTLHCFTLTI